MKSAMRYAGVTAEVVLASVAEHADELSALSKREALEVIQCASAR